MNYSNFFSDPEVLLSLTTVLEGAKGKRRTIESNSKLVSLAVFLTCGSVFSLEMRMITWSCNDINKMPNCERVYRWGRTIQSPYPWVWKTADSVPVQQLPYAALLKGLEHLQLLVSSWVMGPM